MREIIEKNIKHLLTGFKDYLFYWLEGPMKQVWPLKRVNTFNECIIRFLSKCQIK